jgi:hypothetical protein
MGCGGNKGALEAQQKQQSAQDAAIKGATQQINSAFSGFNPQFYQGVANAYQNYAMPQVQQQYQDTSNRLGFKLANQGLGSSSQARFLGGQLQDTMSNAQTQIGQQAVQQQNQLQQQIGQEKSQLIGQAQVANDPGAIAAQSLGVAQGFQTPSSFAPIGQLFNNFATQYLGNQNQQTYGGNQFNQLALGSLLNPQYSTLSPF